ncbi:bifunctional adenosylcobinamide kinase/adenosylcobinamide-phosphate guanylyltransferase [Clostridium thermobutyricum]|uniref:Adenosylcobinamide kinase n=1 Tax=Clostridium thermobutyricum DSM 4928 TaxID=1121339 RepID=A0A1V4SW07_9CLOT|nr:bifunctional adenosylcobinamide kinase/adenosylcobinamide-phosphate guanylyltransferase [Clostridium thermobutyricum]OPX48205.1 bifunctional adenosylcobalamin biosynthesis protein CobU [Clostridium thermobutyricum DSM 4928]
MIIFICGGSKSGKSALGESFSKNLHKEGELIYLATMKPTGEEDLKRIENHKKDREGTNFLTYEILENIEKAEEIIKEKDTVLLDSITSLLANEMFKEKIIFNIEEKIIKGIEILSEKAKNLVIVSDYIFNDSIVYDSITESYRKSLGIINCNIAKLSDVAIEASYSLMSIYKGEEILKNERLI